jgi:hypothetical protein
VRGHQHAVRLAQLGRRRGKVLDTFQRPKGLPVVDGHDHRRLAIREQSIQPNCLTVHAFSFY